MALMKVVERRFERFMRTPLSVRKAMGVIIAATLLSVVLGGALITILDPHAVSYTHLTLPTNREV